ncbi:MAG: PDZ domain-containing protein [bacterium]|nr:PDZ domain-containing protein [bacterium]
MKRLDRVLFFIILLFLLFLMVGGKKVFRSYPETKSEYQYISLFSEVVSMVRTDYVESVEPATKFPGAYSAMLRTLDRQSAYLDAGKTGLYSLYLQGKTCGSGIYGTETGGYFMVTDVAKDSPAEKAGIAPGDMIKAVNGTSIFRLSYWEMYFSLVTKNPGKLELVLLKKGDTEPVIVKLNTLPPARDADAQDAGLVSGKVGTDVLLVELPRIDTASASALEQLLQKESSATNEPLKLIIDLRRYNGGDLEGFTRMAGLFSKEEMSLELKSKHKTEPLTLGANQNREQPLDYRAAIILNPSTRMYGEMLAAVFRKNAMKIVGTATQGFVSKLKHIPLTDGSSILLTESLFLLEGKNLAGAGIKPDIKIKGADTEKITARCISLLDTWDTAAATKASEQGQGSTSTQTKSKSESREKNHERTPEKK